MGDCECSAGKHGKWVSVREIREMARSTFHQPSESDGACDKQIRRELSKLVETHPNEIKMENGSYRVDRAFADNLVHRQMALYFAKQANPNSEKLKEEIECCRKVADSTYEDYSSYGCALDIIYGHNGEIADDCEPEVSRAVMAASDALSSHEIHEAKEHYFIALLEGILTATTGKSIDRESYKSDVKRLSKLHRMFEGEGPYISDDLYPCLIEIRKLEEKLEDITRYLI